MIPDSTAAWWWRRFSCSFGDRRRGRWWWSYRWEISSSQESCILMIPLTSRRHRFRLGLELSTDTAGACKTETEAQLQLRFIHVRRGCLRWHHNVPQDKAETLNWATSAAAVSSSVGILFFTEIFECYAKKKKKIKNPPKWNEMFEGGVWLLAFFGFWVKGKKTGGREGRQDGVAPIVGLIRLSRQLIARPGCAPWYALEQSSCWYCTNKEQSALVLALDFYSHLTPHFFIFLFLLLYKIWLYSL